MTMRTMLGVVIAVAGLSAQGPILSAQGPAARGAGETFTATATVSAPAKKASVPITIHVDRYLSDADRDKVLDVVKKNDNAATTKALAALPDIGYVTLGEKRTPLKYAYARPTGGGRLVTVVTAQPIFFVGGSEKNAKPKEGFTLGLALLVLNGQDTGDGELAPAVKVKVKDGSVVTDEYGSEVVRLVKIAKAK
jgi:hypothetical protein